MAIFCNQLRVFIVEKQTLFGKAIAHVLGGDPEFMVLGLAARPDSEEIAAANPDVIIVDIDAEDAERVVESLRSRCPESRICLLSMCSQPEMMQRYLSTGADGYIVKDSSLQDLLAAIKTVGQGSTYLDPRVAATLLRRRTPSQLPYANQLSPRETDIIRLIAQGLSNRDIGQRLVLSEKTIKNHVSRIFSKLHFTARSQAAVHAIRNGLA